MRALPIAIALLLGTAASARPEAPQAKLDRMIAGKVAGASRQCVQLNRIDQTVIVDAETIVYRENANHLYVNHPRGGCPGLNSFRTLVTRTPSASLCEGDIASIVDAQSPASYGGCVMGPFTPYVTPGH